MPELQRLQTSELGDAEIARRIFDGELPGVVVERALDPAVCAEAVARLEAGSAEARKMGSYPGITYGQVLLTAEELEPYFAAARDLERALPPAVLGGISKALKGLHPSGSIGVPKTISGTFYAAVTVRRLDPGRAIAVHSERANWPAMAALRETIDLSTQVSFYVLLQAPERGGELVLYDDHDGAGARGDEGMDALPHDVIDLEVGDLIVFDGGRLNHRVTEVEGGRARWTIGGFSAFAGSRWYFWS